jgi:hypothetical protein
MKNFCCITTTRGAMPNKKDGNYSRTCSIISVVHVRKGEKSTSTAITHRCACEVIHAVVSIPKPSSNHQDTTHIIYAIPLFWELFCTAHLTLLIGCAFALQRCCPFSSHVVNQPRLSHRATSPTSFKQVAYPIIRLIRAYMVSSGCQVQSRLLGWVLQVGHSMVRCYTPTLTNILDRVEQQSKFRSCFHYLLSSSSSNLASSR